MRTVGIEVLKDKLSECVRMAASGETTLITERERVVAELVPPERSLVARAARRRLAEGRAPGPSVRALAFLEREVESPSNA